MNVGTKRGDSTISLERLQCARRDSAGPTERKRRRKTVHKASTSHPYKKLLATVIFW
jgi:hypothetical protein